MAQPTTTQHTEAPHQAPTPGIGATPGHVARMGAAPQTILESQAEPALQEEPDMVMLMRLYPDAKSAADLRKRAMEAGEAVKAAGAKITASQQDPVVYNPEGA